MRIKEESEPRFTIEALRGQSRRVVACALREFAKDKLTTREWVELRAAIADKSVTTSAITKVIKTLGFRYSDQVIARHRRAECVGCAALEIKGTT